MNPVEPAKNISTPGDFSSYWGFRHSPFLTRVVVPASALLDNQKALAGRLLVAAQEGAPLAVVRGEDGAGTTTLARWLYDALPVSTHMALLLAPGAPGVEPAALSQRMVELMQAAPGNSAGEIAAGSSLRDQMLGLAPVFDWIRQRGKRLAVVLDNAGFLAGESWAAFFLSLLRQGELVDNVVQFFLFGGTSEMEAMSAGWPRALASRTSSFRLQSPADECLHGWLRTRLVMAGMSEARAKTVFSPAAAAGAVHAARGSLTRLGRIAGGALTEAFLAGRKTVEVQDVEAVLNDTTDRVQPASGAVRGQRQHVSSRGQPDAQVRGDSGGSEGTGGDRDSGAHLPRLIDLVKLD
ncbi:MAG: hypothetical protein RIQ81_1430 [Pseudomonadota bacterium]